MSFKDDNLRFTLLKAIVDSATAELAQMRADHLGPLLERFDEDGSLKFSVRLPSTGAIIGALTLPEPKDKYEVTDEAAFTAWFAQAHPDAVTVEVIPGEPEHTIVVPATPDEKVTTIDPKSRTAIMKVLKSTDEGIVDTVTGSYVQGVTFTKGKRPDKFAVTYEDEGRDLLAAAYRAGELDSLVSGTSLPPVNGRVVVERHLETVPLSNPEDPWAAPPAAEPPPADRDQVGFTVPWDGMAPEVNLAEGSEDYGDEATIDDPTWDPGSWGAPADQTGARW